MFRTLYCMKLSRSQQELEGQRNCLYADLYQRAATMDVHSLERLCRRVHSIEIKIRSFRGGIYGNKEQQ